MKVNIKDKKFVENHALKLEKNIKKGIALGLATALGLIQVSSMYKEKNNIDDMLNDVVLEVSSDDVNNMNIIINDNNCSDVFFNNVCDVLREDGLEFTATSNNEGINQDNCVVVTLDQQYSSGEATLIFAPYDNTRLGYSDSLTICMQSAFLQNGFFADNLSAGKIGFRENDNGEVSCLIPTDTEEAINNSYDTSFVTISFGTSNVNATWVAKSIENGLARQVYYLNNFDSNTDLLYRSSENEDVDVVAKYFDSTAHDLDLYNNLKGNKSLNNQVVVNPRVCYMNVFNKNTQLKIDEVKTRAY